MSSLPASIPLGLREINPVRDDIIIEYKQKKQIKSRRDDIKSHYMYLKSKVSDRFSIKNRVIKLTPIRHKYRASAPFVIFMWLKPTSFFVDLIPAINQPAPYAGQLMNKF
jgi:hypothetical protein